MNGLSSGALQSTTSLAQPIDCRPAVRSAVSLTIFPSSATASMLMPALVLPMLTDEQSRSVSAIARGMERISSRSPAENPFCTSAE